MQHKKFRVSFLFLVLLMAYTIYYPSTLVVGQLITETALPSANASQTPNPTILSATTLDRLNVRSGAGLEFSIIRALALGVTVPIIGRNADNSWLQISDGWISSEFVVITGDVHALPLVEPSPSTNRLSYNINGKGLPDSAYLKEHLLRLCPTTVLVMDNLSLADELYQLLRDCGTLVISRSYSVHEGSEWNFRSPQQFVEQWQSEGYPHIVRYSTNEPSVGGTETLQQFVVHSNELMRLAREAGFTVAIGNFAVGTLRAEDIAGGVYDSFLQAIHQYEHYLALHEYTSPVLAFGLGQWPRAYLLNRDQVQAARWARPNSLPMAFIPSSIYLASAFGIEDFGIEKFYSEQGFGAHTVDGILPPYWHLRRGDWLLLRADSLEISRPRIILTEFGWDMMGDISASIEPLRQQYGMPQYRHELRGVNTYARLWDWYWPNWTFPQAVCNQLIWADSLYPPEYIGFQLFTWSSSPDWRQTDFSGNENPALYAVHDCLEVHRSPQ